MPSQQAIIDQIRARVEQLAQAAADAKFWHDRWLFEAGEQRQRRHAVAEAAERSELVTAVSIYDQQIGEAEEQHRQSAAANEQQRDQTESVARFVYEEVWSHIEADAAFMRQVGRLMIAPWSDEGWDAWQPTTPLSTGTTADGADPARVVRVGQLVEQLRWHRLSLPALLPFFGSRGLLLRAVGESRDPAAHAIQSLLLRTLAASLPGRLLFTFVDPIGLGQNAAPFMHLADFDDALVSARAWTEPHHIEQRLADLTEHMENIIQKYLRNQYATIEDYNAHAGEVAEAYRVLTVFDFPANFSEAAARRLVSIAQNGPRCGVYTVVLVDTAKPLPHGFSLSDLEQASTVIAWNGERFIWQDPDFKDCLLELDVPPDAVLFNRIVNAVGEAAKEAGKVEVPFERIAPRRKNWWSADSRAGLSVALGPSGARKVQTLELGSGTAQHALVAGKTGSGKSTLLHTLITSLGLAYSPTEIELYLIDFKKGVEFKTYAVNTLPHARVIAIESEREFGLSVLQGLDAELKRRGDLFRGAGVDGIADYRGKNGVDMPRILLLVDEFQEFFTVDDSTASQTAQILDRLVRQGRAFGVHVLLGSQTLAGSYSLARSTIDQMAVRIALQCTEADSRLILADDNPAARLLSRPGEAIYNAANGLAEGNNRFQVAWLPDDQRDLFLAEINALAEARNYRRTQPQIVFEGNAPAEVEKNQLLSDLLRVPEWPAPARRVSAWLGDPVAIKEPATAYFRRQSASNLLLVGQQAEQAMGMLATALVSLAAQHTPQGRGAARFHVLDFTSADASYAGLLRRIVEALPQPAQYAMRRQLADMIGELAAEVGSRLEAQEEDLVAQPSLYLLIYGLQRARDLRPDEDLGYSFTMSDDEPASPNPAQQFPAILRDGPEVGVHTLVWCDTYTNLGRVLDRRAMREFDQRVAFQMSAEDSSNVVDTPAASKLGQFRALFYSEDEGRLEKFRPYGLPSEAWLDRCMAQLNARDMS